jgi:hypothetical protein
MTDMQIRDLIEFNRKLEEVPSSLFLEPNYVQTDEGGNQTLVESFPFGLNLCC